MRQQFKGVIWGGRKAEMEGQTLHKYVIIGLLVTDKEIPELEKAPPVKDPENEDRVESQVVIDSACPGFVEMLKTIPKRNAKIKVGDATSVLHNLVDI